MTDNIYKSEIRDSNIRELLEKVRKQSYAKYLLSIRLEKIRLFNGAQVNFDFPVTALIGPNGAGKSTVLNAAACVYASKSPRNFFPKTIVSDNSMNDWKLEYEIIEKEINNKGSLKSAIQTCNNEWVKNEGFERTVKLFGVNRTLAPTESHQFMRKRLQGLDKKNVELTSELDVEGFDLVKQEAGRILGKSLQHYKLKKYEFARVRHKISKGTILDYPDGEGYEMPVVRNVQGKRKISIPTPQELLIGGDGIIEYSEFHLGSGEASILRIVKDIENLSECSLVLIEEIENGLHPIAVERLVEYLIAVAKRKKLQVIFTTHSEFALKPLPGEAIWASVEGRLQQGKLSIESLRAMSGRVDKRLAIFVEDDFAKAWIEVIIREKLYHHLDEIGIYSCSGDDNAVRIQKGHLENPSVVSHSICFIDGDSAQKDDPSKHIYRLPGESPEATVFNSVLNNLDSNIVMLTIACQRSPESQEIVAKAIREVSNTNRDSHLLFSQVGEKIGLVPEIIVRGAFIYQWIKENPEVVGEIFGKITLALELPPRKSVS